MGDAYESGTVDIEDHVAQVTLVGPGKGNAMGPAFWAEMPEVFAKLDGDHDVRAIVLTGSGKNFSSGWTCPRWAARCRVCSTAADRPARGRTFTPPSCGCKAQSTRSPTAAPRRSRRCTAGASVEPSI